MQQSILNFLRKNVSTFAWSMADMKGIDPTITTHELNVDPTFKPIRQKRRKLGPDRSKAVNEEVDKLLGAGSIAEVRYPEWLANPRVCVDFTDLNKACPKDSHPLPNIDRLVESTAGNEMLTFMDAFSGYNQIMMHPDDREKTAFITDKGTYCYKVMPFGLKNAGATYQRLVNKMFVDKLGITMEMYIDDMLVKSLHATDHLRHLQECFETLNKYGMKLNPAKCTFGVSSGESGRLTKWAIELGELDITYKNRTAAKSQVLANFLVELAPELEQDLILPSSNWTLHVEGSSTTKGAGARVQLQSPTGELIRQSFSFGFPASNNEAEYKSLIAGLRLAKAVKSKRLSAYCDSQLVVSQFSGDYDARNDRMDAYLKIVQSLTAEFGFFELIKVPRGENICADALTALGSKLRDQVKRTIPIHRIEKPSIDIPIEQTLVAPLLQMTTDLN
ncbi:PREDICTED: uncharacterized protein LOC106338596 [Brassica oleracea var. oleracea]|uniref:uncharacterized protein LOC106338596 n=1 Tax=Brassica oleracea var. oleracea TaxID=109376 RepID=UPI0006A6A257|nr:PREDICTED: uncharacterized protein LOC106338596 [Brassica oleracea var. oleracea]